MNPLNWKRRHLVIWAVIIFAGAVAGMGFAWLVSPLSHLAGADPRTMFFAFLHYPCAGAVTAGLAYYSADLLTGVR